MDVFGILFCMFLLTAQPFIEYSTMVYFVIVNFLGAFVGAAIPAVVLYASTVFRIEQNHMYIIYVGGQLMPLFNPVLCGNWMESDIQGFIYMNTSKFDLNLKIHLRLFSGGGIFRIVFLLQNSIKTKFQIFSSESFLNV